MAYTITVANRALYLIQTGAVNLETDDIKVILMADGFVFDRDDHHVYADVSDDELESENGYEQFTMAITTPLPVETDASDQSIFTCDDVEWTADGGSLVADGAIFIDDTVADDPILFHVDFGGTVTATDTFTFTIQNIEIDYEQGS